MELVQRRPVRRVDRHDVPVVVHPRQGFSGEVAEALRVLGVVALAVQPSSLVVRIFPARIEPF